MCAADVVLNYKLAERNVRRGGRMFVSRNYIAQFVLMERKRRTWRGEVVQRSDTGAK